MKKLLAISLFTGIAIYSLPSLGHHSWNGVYGDGEEVNLVATTVSSVRRNPHAAVDVEFANAAGEIERWTLEWRNGRGGDRSEDAVLALIREGEDFEVSGRKSHTPGKNSIQVREITRLSDGITAAASRY